MNQNYSISYKNKKKIPIIYFEGDMTSESDADLLAKYNQIKDSGSTEKIIINFKNTNYINSAGIATLINIIQDVGEDKQNIAFVGLSSHFIKVMEIVGLTDFVKVFDTEDEAIKSF